MLTAIIASIILVNLLTVALGFAHARRKDMQRQYQRRAERSGGGEVFVHHKGSNTRG